MQSRLSVLFTVLAVAFCSVSSLARAGEIIGDMSFISEIDVGVIYNEYFTGKDHESFSFDTDTKGFYIGNRNSTHFYWQRTETSVTEDTWHHKSVVPYETQDYGFYIEGRVSRLPRHRFGLGVSHRQLPESRYWRTSYQGLCGAKGGCNVCGAGGCAFNEVVSNAVEIAYEYDFSGPWEAGLSWSTEKLDYRQPTACFPLRTSVVSLFGRRDWKRFSARLDFARLSARNDGDYTNSIGNNNHFKLGIEYRPVSHVAVLMDAGLYTRGMPTAGGDFSEIGQKLAIPYLTGDDPFEKLYDERFGYYSLGVRISLK